MTPLVEFSLGPTAEGGFLIALASVALKGFAILAAAGLASLLLRNSSASLKHLCWSVAIAAVLVLPVISLVLPSWTLAVLPGAEGSGAWTVSEGSVAITTYSDAGHESTKPHEIQVPMQTEPDSPALAEHASDPGATYPRANEEVAQINSTSAAGGLSWPALLLWVWLAGAVLVLLYMLAGTIGVWRIVGRARQVSDATWLDLVDEIGDRLSVTRPIQLLQSSSVRVPMVWGIVRPVVLLPDSADEWEDERRRCVLAHELAHVKRLDCLTQWLARAACALHWFNPLVWRASRSMHLEREKACDDYVLSAARTRASNYATYLIEIARQVPTTFSSPPGAVAMARRSQLEGRVLSILQDHAKRSVRRASVVTTVSAALVLMLPIAALQPVQRVAVDDALSESADAKPVPTSNKDFVSIDPDLAESFTDSADPFRGMAPSIAQSFRDSAFVFISAVAFADADASAAEKRSNARITREPRALRQLVQDEIRRSFKVSPGGTLEIRTHQGNIEVRTGSSSSVDVEVRRTPRGGASENDFDVRFEQRDNDVHVVGERLRDGRGSDGINVKFIVTVPRNFNLDLDTKGGNIAVSDLEGRAKVSTSGGNLSFGHITGNVDAQTSGGNVSVTESAGDVRVNTSGGNINLGRVRGTVDVRTSGGNISVDEVGGELQAHTSGGQISARLTKQPEGPCHLKTSGGGITLHLADGIRADLEAKTSAGHVTSDIDILVRGEIRKDRLFGTINGGGPPLILDTSAGDIRIRRI